MQLFFNEKIYTVIVDNTKILSFIHDLSNLFGYEKVFSP